MHRRRPPGWRHGCSANWTPRATHWWATSMKISSAVGRPLGSGDKAQEPVAHGHLPPSGATSRGDLAASPRRSEFLHVRLPGSAAPIRTWVVSPSGRARLRGGRSRSVRAVELSAERRRRPGRGGRRRGRPGSLRGRDARRDRPHRAADRAAGTSKLARRRPGLGARLPAADGRLGMVGFSRGGSAAFAYAVDRPELNTLVVYYGEIPEAGSDYARIDTSVLGLYGGDLQTAATVPQAAAAMVAAGKFRGPSIGVQASWPSKPGGLAFSGRRFGRRTRDRGGPAEIHQAGARRSRT